MGSDRADRWQAGACRAVVELALARHGRLTRASVALGYERSHLAKHLRSARHLNLYRLLAGLRVDPARFARYAHALDDEPVLEAFGMEAVNLATRRPTLLRRAAPVLCRFLDGELDGDEPPFDALDVLGARVRSEPEHLAEILDRATEVAHTANSVAFACRALATASDALRGLGRADESQVTVWVLLRLAAQSEDESLLATMIRHGVYVLSDRGDFHAAVEFIDLSCRLCRGLQEADAYGRSLFIRGLMLKRDGQDGVAFGTLETSLEFLSADSRMHVFGAHQNLADLAMIRNDLETALRHADLAASAVDDQYSGARLSWLRGRLAFRLGRFSASAHHYQQTVRSLRSSPLDATLAGLEYVRVLLRLGLGGEVHEHLKVMKAQVHSLEGESILAAGALWEVLRLERASAKVLFSTVVGAIDVLERALEERATFAPTCTAG